MLYQLSHLRTCNLQTADESQRGLIEDAYFDDESWKVRYVVLDTRAAGTGRRVLVAPEAIVGIDVPGRQVQLNLTAEQLDGSPSIESHQPVTRQHEMEVRVHFGWPVYWPQGAEEARTVEAMKSSSVAERQPEDTHLQSAADVAGFFIRARDGDVGHVDDYIVNVESWVIRYLIIDTANWWPGRKVAIPPAWVGELDWKMSTAQVDHMQAEIRAAPEFDASRSIDRAFEERLHAHYNRPPYWS